MRYGNGVINAGSTLHNSGSMSVDLCWEGRNFRPIDMSASGNSTLGLQFRYHMDNISRYRYIGADISNISTKRYIDAPIKSDISQLGRSQNITNQLLY